MLNRRSLYAALAGGLVVAINGVKSTYAATKRKRPANDEEALKLLQENGLIAKDMTWDKIAEISKRIGGTDGAIEAGKWQYIIKDKYVYRGED